VRTPSFRLAQCELSDGSLLLAPLNGTAEPPFAISCW
jgi:hypothetical protein